MNISDDHTQQELNNPTFECTVTTDLVVVHHDDSDNDDDHPLQSKQITNSRMETLVF